MPMPFLQRAALALVISGSASAQRLQAVEGPKVAITNNSKKSYYIQFPVLASEKGDPLLSINFNEFTKNKGTTHKYVKRGGDTFELKPNVGVVITWDNRLKSMSSKKAPEETSREFSLADARVVTNPDLPRAWFWLHNEGPVTVDASRTNSTALNRTLAVAAPPKDGDPSSIEITLDHYSPPPKKP